MQMYNEEVNDLLAPEHKRLAVHESREAGVYVAGALLTLCCRQ
jgi:centromeric protein E